jgi:hypothetical protein
MPDGPGRGALFLHDPVNGPVGVVSGPAKMDRGPRLFRIPGKFGHQFRQPFQTGTLAVGDPGPE